MRVAAEYGDGIGVPTGRLQNGISDLGPIRRKRCTVFQARVVRETLGFAVGKDLDVDLVGGEKAAAAADKRDHAAVW